jgi:antirestriction protein ArdC
MVNKFIKKVVMETSKQKPANGSQKDVYTIVNERIIDQLTKGTIPWHMPWSKGGIPMNLISKRPYQGINLMLLAYMGYEQNLFLTSKQLNELGGSIKPDEKPHIVVYWNYFEKEQEGEETASKKKQAYLRYYTVFNVAQCNGIPPTMIPPKANPEFRSIEICDQVVKEMPLCPTIKHKEQKAYYDPLRDFVNMPKQTSFKTEEGYHTTLFHELIHSTGHRSRLDRKDVVEMHEFGSEPYSHEELVAEIGACYLNSHVGIESQFEHNTAYIQGWLKRLQNDRKFIFSAARHAQKATDFILNIHIDKESNLKEE